MINAISGISLYEYYYTINKDKKEKESSPIAKEMKKYGLTPTDNDSLNIAMLKRAKELQENQNQDDTTVDYASRPWADIMYQLNLPFNDDPKDDIADIKEELAGLMKGVSDPELEKEIQDLEEYVTSMYISYGQNNQTADIRFNTLGAQLNNLSNLNKVNLI